MSRWKRGHRVVVAIGFLASVVASSTFIGADFVYREQPYVQQLLLIFLLPSAAAALLAGVQALQRRQVLLADARMPDPAVDAIVFWVVVFLVGMHVMVLTVLVGVEAVQPLAARAVVALGGVTMVAIGNALPRTRPNTAVGIRTSRTLVDRQLWMLVHRASGYLFVLIGLGSLATTAFLSGPVLMNVAGGALLAAALAMSIYYRRLTQPGAGS
jgi:uncharacterized membrane protein